ncbi:hypothetical protein GCM10027299_56000 [Larkinella ripae]
MPKQVTITEPELSSAPTDVDETKPEFSKTKVSGSITELKKSTTKHKGGRPRRAPDVGLWAIRGVDLETRGVIEKVAQRSGKTIGQFLNEDVRSYAQEQLKKGEQMPIRQEDIRTELDGIKTMITQLAERIPVQDKKGFFSRLFG